ncbi:MAG: tyrosine-type recombinase/integrase [Acidimicrobiales bacterium]
MSPPAGLSPDAEGFLADLAQRGRAANTVAAYRRDLATYERFLHGRGLSVPQAGEDDVAAYVAALTAAGRKPASVARAVVVLRALHRWCGSDAAVEVATPEPDRADPSVLTEAEAAALVGSPRGNSAVARRDRALLEVLYATGARISEVVGLCLGDVAGGVARLGGPRPRVVPYGRPAADAIEVWTARGGRDAMAGPGRAGPSDALFLNQRGGRLSRQWGWSVVRHHGEQVGMAGRLAPHVLRHSFAVHLAGRGAPAAVVQQLLVGLPDVLSLDELVEGYRRWHPRALRTTSQGRPHSY